MFDNGMVATGFGGLTADSQISYNNNGTAFLKFSLGVSKSKKVNEEWVKENHYFNCVIIGRFAETMQNHLFKGTQVWISGDLSFSAWEDNGAKRSKVEIKVKELEIISKNDSQDQQGGNNQNFNGNNSYNNQGGNNSFNNNYPSGSHGF